MGTMFINTVFDPVIAIVGVLIPLGMAYVIVALQTRFENKELKQPSVRESTQN
jgi:hypothetical protein